jgi:hypothetical protein
MKRIVIKLIHFLAPNYFCNKTYGELREKWGIADVCYGKIYFIECQQQEK